MSPSGWEASHSEVYIFTPMVPRTVIALRKRLPAVLAVAASMLLLAGGAQVQSEDSFSLTPQLIGQAAPGWVTQGWINAEALELRQLRGRVVMLRFLNDSASGAAALNRLHALYAARGLAVVAIYMPTPFPAQVSREQVHDLAEAQGFEFPIGLDPRWETLHRYWLERADAELTATTFLIDRKGVIRYVQPDGNYDKDSASRAARGEYAKLEKEIQALLKSDAATAGGNATEPKPRRRGGKQRSENSNHMESL